VTFQTVCVRHRSRDNLALAERINRSGFAYLTPTVVGGVQILRISIGAMLTERVDVAALWERLQQEAAS
jgi:aromatic-L-amino-acid decarboxylase